MSRSPTHAAPHTANSAPGQSLQAPEVLQKGGTGLERSVHRRWGKKPRGQPRGKTATLGEDNCKGIGENAGTVNRSEGKATVDTFFPASRFWKKSTKAPENVQHQQAHFFACQGRMENRPQQAGAPAETNSVELKVHLYGFATQLIPC